MKPTLKLTEEQRKKAQQKVLIEMRKKAYLDKQKNLTTLPTMELKNKQNPENQK